MIRWLKWIFGNLARRSHQPIAPTRISAPPIPMMHTARDVTDWDIALITETIEPGRIEYRFLGVTGEEES